MAGCRHECSHDSCSCTAESWSDRKYNQNGSEFQIQGSPAPFSETFVDDGFRSYRVNTVFCVPNGDTGICHIVPTNAYNWQPDPVSCARFYEVAENSIQWPGGVGSFLGSSAQNWAMVLCSSVKVLVHHPYFLAWNIKLEAVSVGPLYFGVLSISHWDPSLRRRFCVFPFRVREQFDWNRSVPRRPDALRRKVPWIVHSGYLRNSSLAQPSREWHWQGLRRISLERAITSSGIPAASMIGHLFVV